MEHTKQDEAYESTFTCLDFKSRFVDFRPILLDFDQRILSNLLLFIIQENICRFSNPFAISLSSDFHSFCIDYSSQFSLLNHNICLGFLGFIS